MPEFDPTARVDLLPETRAYLRDWLAWVERGAPEAQLYRRCWGLCSNAPTEYVWRDLQNCFGRGLGCPFGKDAYVERSLSATMHEDPNRLAWVRINAPDDAEEA